MACLVVFLLFAALFDHGTALFCYNQVCTGANQYCQIQIHSPDTSFCHTGNAHGHGHHEDHQLCIGAHHPGDHCFCKTQQCVDEMARQLTTTVAPVTNAPVTQAPVTQAPITQGPTQAQTTVAGQTTPVPVAGTTTMAPQTTTTTAGPTTTTAPMVTTAPPSLGPTICQDNESGNFTCADYNNQYGMCTSLTPTLQTIAKTRCPKFCNLCGGGTAPTQSTLSGTTALPPCEDHDARCSQQIYSSILCNPATAPETKAYAIKTCPKTCNYCNEFYASLTAPAKCHVCGNSANQIPCGQSEILTNVTANMVTCSTEKFCMTDVFNDGKGNVDVFKRCVDEDICRKKWIAESADQDYCNKYGTVTPANAFECHFCCHGDFCNTNIKPELATLVTKN